MPDRKRRAPDASPNPMEEENFPTRSPTRDAVEREMQEPSNIRGPAQPAPRKTPPTQEAPEGDSHED